VQFWQRRNGGEGFIGQHYVMLWSVEDFIEMNTGTYFAEAAPGLVVFGSDGGGEAFGFDTRSAPPPIVVAPYVGMEWVVAFRIAPTFDLFLQHLYTSEDIF
jgi:SMI1/KNR4 family protein SUKH-1